jgi:N-acetylneuraminic acid mutarotase
LIALAAIGGILTASALPGLGQSTSPVWSTLAPMPTARQEVSVSVLDGKVFVIAGYDTLGQSTATVEVYDPRTNAWQKAAPLPIATNHNAAATANGRLYAFGGTSPRVFVYARDVDSWTEVASMRYSHGGTPAVAVIGGKIYVAGGTGSDMVGHELEVYDPGADKWQALAPMGVPRNHTAGGAIGGRFHVVGGRGSPDAATAHEVYDPTTNAWTPRAPLPTGRSGIAAGVVGERLYVFGGERPRLFGEVEVYDPATDRWQSLLPMPDPRHGIFAGVIGTTIYLPGGATRQGLGATNVNSAFRVSP